MPALTFWARRMQPACFGGVRVLPDVRTHEETRTPPEPTSFVIAEWFVVPGGLFWLAVQRSPFRRRRLASLDREPEKHADADGLVLGGLNRLRGRRPRFARRPNTRGNAHAARARRLRRCAVVRCPRRALLARGPTKSVVPDLARLVGPRAREACRRGRFGLGRSTGMLRRRPRFAGHPITTRKRARRQSPPAALLRSGSLSPEGSSGSRSNEPRSRGRLRDRFAWHLPRTIV